jgi:hypothetical protein
MAALAFLKDHPAANYISGGTISSGPTMPGSDGPPRRQDPASVE